MINPTVLETKLAGLIGFKQPYDPAYAIIDAANLLRNGQSFCKNPKHKR